MDNAKKITHKEKPMTLREYIAHLRKFTRKYGDLPVIDCQFNMYQHITYCPTGLGHFDGYSEFQQYRPKDSDNDCEKEDINAVCLN